MGDDHASPITHHPSRITDFYACIYDSFRTAIERRALTMQQQKGYLIGQLGLRLSYAQWASEGEPKALALLVHGYGEHSGRYLHLIEALNQHGYAVFTIDHRGHGESEGERACVEQFDYFVDDLHLLVGNIKEAYPIPRTSGDALPLFMIGHSMGGLIATRYALAHEAELRGLVLSGAALQVGDDVSPFLKAISKWLAKLIPNTAIFANPENALSRDPEVERRFDADPLCYKGKVKARMGYEMMIASEDARARMAQLSLPLLIMHATDDQLTNPAGSQEFYEQARSQDKTLKLWQDYKHELFNELEKEQVIDFMIEWLDERVA
jgi:alpha-beta hydrolase superfamily lysophospholipase